MNTQKLDIHLDGYITGGHEVGDDPVAVNTMDTVECEEVDRNGGVVSITDYAGSRERDTTKGSGR